jgi:glycosyltransferase involved in cell wall biosynthesis
MPPMPPPQSEKQRLLILVVAYNAQKTITSVLLRIPHILLDSLAVQILVIDDASNDTTFELASKLTHDPTFPFDIEVLINSENQGYGGNQKLGFLYAIQNGFDFVALLHGDGQYSPESLPDLVQPLARGEYDAVFGSRMANRFNAIRGGMPLYKFVGNWILTTFQNWVLGTSFSELHSGYRLYQVKALQTIPFHQNTQGFNFDTEVCYQLLLSQHSILEIPIPTYYGEELCYVDGLRYAREVFTATLKFWLKRFGLLHDAVFSIPTPSKGDQRYKLKLGFPSPHTIVIESVGEKTRVLDIGCGDGRFSSELIAKGCIVTGIDALPPSVEVGFTAFHQNDLELGLPPNLETEFDYVLMLDVLEHLSNPEKFLESLSAECVGTQNTTFIATTGNIAFLPIRLSLLFGFFNYGPRGILDFTHKRLFSFATFKRLFQQSGFEPVEIRGIPAPFPLLFGDGLLSKILLAVNNGLISISKSLFAFQIYGVFRPRPSLRSIIESTYLNTKSRLAEDHPEAFNNRNENSDWQNQNKPSG